MGDPNKRREHEEMTRVTRSLDIIDVTPLDIGLQMPNGEMEVLISRNTAIPASKRRVFTAAHDNRSTIYLELFGGVSRLCVHNKLLAKIWIAGIKPAPKGAPVIDVTFDIDANGIMSISAKEIGRGKQSTVITEASGGASKNDIEKML